MRLADRQDAYGVAMGLVVFLLFGVVLGVVFSGGAAAWLSSFALGCAATNVTSYRLRRRMRRKASGR